jgi:Na+/proline symporter
MLDRVVATVRIVALTVAVIGITAWCATDLRQGLTVLLMVVTVPPLTLLVKTVVEGMLVLIDDRLHRGGPAF